MLGCGCSQRVELAAIGAGHGAAFRDGQEDARMPERAAAAIARNLRRGDGDGIGLAWQGGA